jgi:hypothetical protein
MVAIFAVSSAINRAAVKRTLYTGKFDELRRLCTCLALDGQQRF